MVYWLVFLLGVTTGLFAAAVVVLGLVLWSMEIDEKDRIDGRALGERW